MNHISTKKIHILSAVIGAFSLLAISPAVSFAQEYDYEPVTNDYQQQDNYQPVSYDYQPVSNDYQPVSYDYQLQNNYQPVAYDYEPRQNDYEQRQNDYQSPFDYQQRNNTYDPLYDYQQRNYSYDPLRDYEARTYDYQPRYDYEARNYDYNSLYDYEARNYSYDPRYDYEARNYSYDPLYDYQARTYSYDSLYDYQRIGQSPSAYGYGTPTYSSGSGCCGFSLYGSAYGFSGGMYYNTTPTYSASCGCYSYPQQYRQPLITGGVFTGSVIIPPQGPSNPQPPDSYAYQSYPTGYTNTPPYMPNYVTSTYQPPTQTAPVYNAYQQPQYQNVGYGGGSQMIQLTQNPIQTITTSPSYVSPSARVAAAIAPVVALSQIPYTGIDTDILFTIALALGVMLILGAIAYFVGFFKKGMFGKILLGIY